MKTKIYKSLPRCAKEIRQKVFVEEQGFQKEFDKIDEKAVHIVVFNMEKMPVATCRIYWSTEMEAYILGRIAVIKEYRGKKIGSVMLNEAEKYVRGEGGRCIALHAQCKAAVFYEKSGYEKCSGIDEEEGCPHVWMKKGLK